MDETESISKLVAVIIPCYNAEHWIRETLLSVMIQAIPEMEVIVVDDGSTDATTRIIQEEFSEVRLIETENRGTAHARNVGTKAANGKYLQFLDHDDLLAPGKLELQIQQLESTSGDVAYGDWQDLWQLPDGSFGHGKVNQTSLQRPNDIDFFTAVIWWPLAAVLFTRKIIAQVGGWNERLSHVVDTRMFFDCANHGAKFIYCSQLMAQYRRHRSGSQFTGTPIGLSRDKVRNAKEVEALWISNGGLTEERKAALITVYFQISRASSEIDPESFKIACSYLNHFSRSNRFRPTSPAHLVIASWAVGYQNAEMIAVLFRRFRRFMGRIFHFDPHTHTMRRHYNR